MLKIRLMGTKNDITWFKKIMQRHPKVEVLEMSDLYPNKGTDKYYRSYVEVKKSKGHQHIADRELWKSCKDIQGKHSDVRKGCGNFSGRCEYLSA